MNKREYDKRQITTLSRYRSGIKAHKVLDIVGGELIFRLFPNSNEIGKFHVDAPESYNTGEYIDIIVIRQSRTSNSIELVGHTPDKFIPTDSSDISE